MLPRVPMKKRKREEEAGEEVELERSITRKKARKESDDLGKFMSFVEAGDILAGIQYNHVFTGILL